ncbi:MAG: undecaprenyl-diphosphate phosphatase [Candidatus Alcyoniella australis]|nr:undecaprenyl-diphosphate phosphatase [Candidatus Alcyoniella australis]
MLLKSIVLGIVQGLTEFLPVSSSGHLVIGQRLLGLEPDLLFDVLVHFGTLLAVLVVFRRDIYQIIIDSLRFIRRPRGALTNGSRMALMIVIASVPTALIGLAFKDWFESLFQRPALVSITLALTGVLLLATRWSAHPSRDLSRMTIWIALLIGTAQALAIIPGISRSGATIAAGLFLGLERELAGRFAFLIAIPAILGAVALQGSSIDLTGLDTSYVLALFLGVAASFISGLIALYALIGIVRRGKLYLFAAYCLPLACIYGIFCLITGV